MRRTPHRKLLRDIAFSVAATDLDGTLLRSDLTVSPRTRLVLDRIRARGMRHLVVTGRQAAGCRRLLDGLGYRGLAVCGQGTQLYDCDRRQLVWSTTLDRGLARVAVAAVEARLGAVSVGVATAGIDGHILVPPGFYSSPGDDCELVLPEQLWQQPIEKVFLRHRSLRAPTLAEHVWLACGDAVHVTYSHSTVVELLPPGATKGHGLARAADQLGFEPAQTIAFGDMPNDIPILEWAGHGVAMGNGDALVQAVADEIGPSNDADGVAVVLERLCAGSSAAYRSPDQSHDDGVLT